MAVFLSSYDDLFDGVNQIRPRLFLGSMRAARDRELLKQHNITHVLVAASNLTQHFPAEIRYKQISLRDEDDEDLLGHLPACVDFIRQAISSGGCVLVHCAAGISRSSAVVIAYLVATENLSPTVARADVKQRRPVISPNPGFVRQLEAFHARCLAQCQSAECVA